MANHSTPQRETLFGHPVGLYTLFFAEMWERFSFYGMRALLVLFMAKGFLKLGDKESIAIYGAYTSLVYMMPFFGGMVADRLLGPRRAVVLGGLLMAAGHLMMTVEHSVAFFGALALLIAGNGFFKPNISTMVGSLYPQGSRKRDGGFTIFYMGVNLGAALAPLLCGYLGEKVDWHYGFGLATIGMLTGIAVFVAPSIVSQLSMAFVTIVAAVNIFVVPKYFDAASDARTYLSLAVLGILVVAGVIALRSMGREKAGNSNLSRLLLRLVIAGTAIAASAGCIWFAPDDMLSKVINYFVAIVLLVAAAAAWIALGRGGLPAETGAPLSMDTLRKPIAGLNTEWWAYLISLLAVPVLALFVSGFNPTKGRAITFVSPELIKKYEESGGAGKIAAVVLHELATPAGILLFVCGIVALGYIALNMRGLDRIPRQRMYVVLTLTFFSLLFFAFFEQAGSSVNYFTDRNVNRVVKHIKTIDKVDVGSTITIQPTQEQLGFSNGENVFTINQLDKLRDAHKDGSKFTIDWKVAPDNVGMNLAEQSAEIPASWFQAVNPVYILIFGLVFTALWAYLGKRGLEPSTPVKFSFGLLQLGLGFAAFWYGAHTSDSRGMVALVWLFAGYMLQTTGELCLSPVGLSMITKLTPAFLVSTVMGMWFLASAFAQFLAAIIAQFTSVDSGNAGVIPPPIETVHLYGGVYGKIAIASLICGIICLLLSPLLTKWMHNEAIQPEANTGDA